MLAVKFPQYQYECEGWKRRLVFMMEENIYAKNRIAEILKEPVDDTMLAALDNFQTGFMEKDTLIAMLRDEIAEFEKNLLKKKFEAGVDNRALDSAAKKLRRQVDIAEQAFNNYQQAFRSFLAENV